MNLSQLIAENLDRNPHARIFETTRPELDHWQQMAERAERSARDAWRSFYVACGVVGLLVAGGIWQHHHDTATPAPVTTQTTKAVWI